MKITTIILAGGRGSRIGGNKAMQVFNGRPLIAWVLDAVRPLSDEIIINTNENRSDYAQFNCRLFSDLTKEYAGPLAGLQVGLRHARHQRVLCVPCDTPFLPNYLIARLCLAVGEHDAAVANVDSQRQPTIALYQKRVLPKLNIYLSAGGRKVSDWLDSLDSCDVPFEQKTDFLNINTQQELHDAAFFYR